MAKVRRFSSAKTETFTLGAGESAYTIEILDRLSHGEREEMLARIAPETGLLGNFKADRRKVRTEKVYAYLLRWTLLDDDTNEPVPYSTRLSEGDRTSAIRNLDPDTFDEIYAAIEKHERASDAARDLLKKATGGAPSGARTSPSPSDATGDTNGSETSIPTITMPSSVS